MISIWPYIWLFKAVKIFCFQGGDCPEKILKKVLECSTKAEVLDSKNSESPNVNQIENMSRMQSQKTCSNCEIYLRENHKLKENLEKATKYYHEMELEQKRKQEIREQETAKESKETKEKISLLEMEQISQNLLQRIHEVEGKNVDLMLQLKELNSTSSYPLEKSTSLKKFNFYHS
eukprot:Sdes_comp19281_c0_seq4m10305